MNAPVLGGWSYLSHFLEPLAPYLTRTDVTDLYVNRPGELWIETLDGSLERHSEPRLTRDALWHLVRQVAALSSQGISREHPLLSAALPDGSRIQVVAPPATSGELALAIRKHVSADLTLEDYENAGAFAEAQVGGYAADRDIDGKIAEALKAGQFTRALRMAVRGRRNILVSGGTATGKTTFLNALLREIPAQERLLTIEDTPELRLGHANRVSLLATRGELGEARVSANDLVSASLRMRPDRIILGELRGEEALAFLRAINTGHPGSMTTIHADSPAGAIEQLILLVVQGGTRLTRADVRDYVLGTISLFVQLGRTGGRRYIADVALASQLKAQG